MLLVFLMAAVIAIALYRQLPRVAFESQRAKEQLLIERGEQYRRGIQLFVRKYQRYPARIEELENTNNMRYLRRRYKDPMTGKDEWRLIRAGPGGVLLDSINSKGKPGDNKDANQNRNTFIAELPVMGATTGIAGQGAAAALRRRPSEMAGMQGQPGVPGMPGQPGEMPGMPGQIPGQPYTGQPGQPAQPYAGQPYGGMMQPAAPGMQAQPGYPGAMPGQPGAVPGQPFTVQPFPGGVPGIPGVPGMPGVPGAPRPQTMPGQPGAQPSGPQPYVGGQPYIGSQPYVGGQPYPGAQPNPGGQPYPSSTTPSSMYPGPPANSQTGGMPQFPYNTAPGSLGAAPRPPFGQPGLQSAPGQMGPNAATQMIQQILTSPRPGGMPGGMVGGGAQIGAGIAGVATTFEQSAIMIYEDHDKYQQWEFIYDPSKDRAAAGLMQQGQGQPPGTPANQLNKNPRESGFGQSGFGQSGFGQSGFGQSGFGSQPQPAGPRED